MGQRLADRDALRLRARPARGRLENGEVTQVQLLPVSRAPVSAPASGRFRFVAWDANGTQLASLSFRAYPLDHARDVHGFHFSIPRPPREIHHYEIRAQSPVAPATLFSGSARSTMQTADVPTVAWEDGRARVTWRPEPDAALIVRDALGRVVTINRTGAAVLSDVTELSLEVVASGRSRGVILSTRNSNQSRTLR